MRKVVNIQVEGEGLYVCLRPPASLLFIPQVTYECGVPRWNDIDRRIDELEEKPIPVPLNSITNPNWTKPDTNP
jgi:hypothetical protein